MNRKIFFLCSIFLSTFCVFFVSALELDNEELRRALRENDLEFIDYKGFYDRIDTIDQIISIGRTLGKNWLKNPSAKESIYTDKYKVLRLVEEGESENLLNADIYILEKGSQVDSILNLRRMLSGYLMESFHYSLEDSQLLAKLITIYNAIYRGDMSNIQNFYSSSVASSVQQKDVGLARVYSQWAGKTKILIPLRSTIEGGAAALVNVNALTTDQVMSTLLKSESIPAKVAQKIVDQKDSTNQQEQKSVTMALDNILHREQSLIESEKSLEEELSKAKEGQGERSLEEIQADLDDLRKEKKSLVEQKSKALSAQNSINKDEKSTDSSRKDTQDLIQKQSQQDGIKEVIPSNDNSLTQSFSVSQMTYSVRPNENGSDVGVIVSTDTSNKNAIKESQDNNIKVGSLLLRNQDIVALVQEEDGLRLKSYDKTNLKEKDQAFYVISSFSQPILSVDLRNVYAIVEQDNEWHIAKFGQSLLEEEALSKEAVSEESNLTIKNGKLIITKDNNSSEFDLESLDKK